MAKGLLQQGSRKQGCRQGFSSPSQGWELPRGWKNPRSKAFVPVPTSPFLGEVTHLHARPAGLQLVRGGPQSSAASPPTKFYTSPAASQPRAAAVGIPNIYPKPSGFYRHIQQRYLHTPGFWVCPALLSGSRSAYLPPRHTHPQGYACPPAAACPPQSRLFANHTQDTQGTQRVFANGKPILKLTVKLVRPTRQLGNDKQRA